MTTFLIDTIGAVFRPSVAALAIVIGASILTVENGAGPASFQSVKLDQALCNGALAPVCKAFTF